MEQPFLRNVLISEYCSLNFNFVNIVDLYYRRLDSNIIVVILIVLIVFPCLFITMSAAAEGYLAVSLKGLSRRLRFSPSLAATTVVAFANGAPDLLSSLASVHKSESTLMSLATLLGAFMFTSTIVMTNVLSSVPSQIVLPKLAVIKEIGFYTFSILSVCVLGFFKAKTLTFVTMLLGTYIAYIFATIIVEKKLEIERKELIRMNLKDEENGKLRTTEDLRKIEANPQHLEQELEKKLAESQMVNETYANTVPQSMGNNLRLIYEELFDPDLPVVRQYCQLILSAGGLFTIPYIYNPLMGTKARFLVIFGAVFFCARMLLGPHQNIFLYPGAAAGVAVVCLILELLKVNQRFIDTIYEIIAVFAAVSWIKIICVLILDFISFWPFIFRSRKSPLPHSLSRRGTACPTYSTILPWPCSVSQ